MGSRGQGANIKKIKITGDQRFAAEEYMAETGFAMNEYLRTGELDEFYGTKEQQIKYINDLTDLIDNNPINKDMVTWRGLSTEGFNSLFGLKASDLKNPVSLIGKTGTDDGFGSMSPFKETAEEYGYNGVVLKISLSKGTSAIPQSMVNSAFGGEEVTLNRGANYKIKGVKQKGSILEVSVDVKTPKKRKRIT